MIGKCELCGYEGEVKISPNGYMVCLQCYEGELDPDLALPPNLNFHGRGY